MSKSRPDTIGELKAAGYRLRSVRAEARENLLAKLRAGEPLFPGIIGYDDTVIPQMVNALLSRQNFILLGLRGQAKSRIVRQLVDLLDDEVPVLAGSEVNDDPLRPISKQGRLLVENEGDDAPIEWLPRQARFVEKLATPDVTIADIIGDVDPIRAARGGHVLSDELVIHYGLLPRANRGIFAVNELPDLAGKIQVGLFNVLQEGDVQIKGFPVRLPLDVLMVFTANPEDYTARGKIITPLKDRIGAEISTHYPRDAEIGRAITRQEARIQRDDRSVDVPWIVEEVIERIARHGRVDKRIDQRSGLSQRMPITVLENAVSNAERRAVICHDDAIVPRISDIYAALPAITGKLELEYEGELAGSEKIARELIESAAFDTFYGHVGTLIGEETDMEGAPVSELDLLTELTSPDDSESLTELERRIEEVREQIVDYFENGGVLQIGDIASADACLEGFRTIPGLLDLVLELDLAPEGSAGHVVTACELILEELVYSDRLTRSDVGGYKRTPRRAAPAGGTSGPEGPIEI